MSYPHVVGVIMNRRWAYVQCHIKTCHMYSKLQWSGVYSRSAHTHIMFYNRVGLYIGAGVYI